MMTSSGIRGIRRKKTAVSEVKVLIVGAASVGKSALTVRFLTRRYIGEYDQQTDNKYKQEIMVDGEPILIELWDHCSKNVEDDLPNSEAIHWADAYVMMYSITDRTSFNYVKQMKQHVTDLRMPNTRETVASLYPLVLIGNKSDMVHLRQVSTEEGEILAKDFDCHFWEITVAEQVNQIADVFHELCREVHNIRRKNKQSLLDRMLGNVSHKGGIKVYARGKSDSALPKD